MADIDLSILDREKLEARLDEVRAADADQGWMSWEDDSYLVDLPQKWAFSKLAEHDGRVAGYALCSEKQDTVWLHRIAVAPDSRSLGVGTRLLGDIEDTARERGYVKVGLKTPTNNTRARQFYVANGYGEEARGTEYATFSKVLSPRTIGVHQPNFLPWLGYFYKLLRSDTFVILDDVLAPSRGYFNRSKVLVQGKGRWLTVPVHRNDGYIHHMTPDGDEWVTKHVGTLQFNYGRTPFYDELMPDLTELIQRYSTASLAELNEALILHVASLLGISTPCVRSSEYDLDSRGDQRLVDLVKAVHGSSYLSGSGGDNYQETETFTSSGLDLVYTGFKSTPYTQQNAAEFTPGLSAIDALFNIGPGATRQLLDDAPDPMPTAEPVDSE